MLGCVKEDEVRLSSHGDAAIELLDLFFEELLELWPPSLQCRRQEAICNGEHLVVDIDILHLVERKHVE